jgi:septum formation topological specificity factor MinE
MSEIVVKNQHFVPRFYLDRFTFLDDRAWKVHVYDRLEHRYFKNSLDGVGSEKYFFKDPRVEGTVTEVELEVLDSLTRAVESFSTGSRRLDPDDKNRLAQLIAFQRNRTRAARDEFERMQSYIFETVAKHLQVHDGMTREEAGKLFPVIPVEELHALMLDNSVSLAFAEPLLFQYGWFFVRCPQNASFLTSDHPVTMNRGWLNHPENCIIFPLSPDLALVLQQGEDNQGYVGELEATEDWINDANYNQAVSAQRFVYSSSLEVLRQTIDSINNLPA